MSEDAAFTHIQDDFCKLFGSPNYSMHSNLCDVARKASFKTVMGDDRPLADFIQTKYIMLFGEPDLGHQVGLPAPDHHDGRGTWRALRGGRPLHV
jgi:anaerobic selenocysteine-containing dehydrogenase